MGKDLKDLDRPALLVDKALEGRKNLISGATKRLPRKECHAGGNFHPTVYADLRAVTAGEACPKCGSRLRIDTAVEIGHIFKLGYKYSESMAPAYSTKTARKSPRLWQLRHWHRAHPDRCYRTK